MPRPKKNRKDALLAATMLGVERVIDVLRRPIDNEVDDDKLKAAVDGKNKAIDYVNDTLIYIDGLNGDENFLLEKIKDLVEACYDCFDILTSDVIPKGVSEELVDNKVSNAIVAKQVARQTCENIDRICEDMEKMLETGKVTLKKDIYKVKTIESIARANK